MKESFTTSPYWGRAWACSLCGKEHRVPLRWALLEERSLWELPRCWASLGVSGPLLLVADEITWEVAGRKALQALAEGGWSVREAVFSLPLEASDESAAWLEERWPLEVQGAVAVGSGTINDLVKWVASQRGCPYIALPTAASMNGYASSIAALTVAGVKRTLPCQPPVGILTQPDIVASAPREMTAAGYADLGSKAVADADWRLAHFLWDEGYCPLPRQLLEPWEARLEERWALLREGEPKAVVGLLAALVDSGVGMTIAGSSSPASGGEHLISHWLDMQAKRSGRKPSLHGLQVGLGTLVAAALYELWLETEPSQWQPSPQEARSPAERRAELQTRYGPQAEEVLAQWQRKWLPPEMAQAARKRLASQWEALQESVRQTWRPPQVLRERLKAVGAATSPQALGVSIEEFREAVLHAREIRGRWTILDFAYLVGLLPSRLEEVMARCGW